MMNVEAVSLQNTVQAKFNKSTDQASSARKKVDDMVSVDQAKTPKVQPEELLSQIRGLTEEGLYSVRFENDERMTGLVVKIVDRQDDTVIRQFPAEEILHLKETLESLRGNLLDTPA